MSARSELSTLEASGLIQIAALQPELEYLFRHALVQEAAYASLLKQDRKMLHRAAAETLLMLHPDRQRELAGVVGMHFDLAGDSEKAAEHLTVAGEDALERFANKEAATFFVRATGLATDAQPDVRLRAAIGCAKSGWTLAHNEDDVARLEQAVEGAGANPTLVAEAYFWIAFLRRQKGEVPESSPALRSALERAAEIGTGMGDPAAVALPRALMGAFVAFTGDLHGGARQMQEALDAVQQKADAIATAMVSDFLAMALGRLGEFAAAEETIKRSHDFAGDDIARVDVDIARATLELERGNLDMAWAAARDCTARAEELGAYACVIASSVTYGAASLARQDAPSAKGTLERGRELCLVTNIAPMRTLIHGLLGSARAQMGDIPGGVEGWNAALEGARSMSDRYGEAQTLWGRGRTHARQESPDLPAALADLERAVALFEAMDAKPSLARSLYDQAGVLRALGRGDDAARDEARALDIGRRLGLRDAPFA